MKIAPITVTQMALIGGVCVFGYLAYRTFNTVSNMTVSGLVSDAVAASAVAVDARKPEQNANEFSFGGVQQAVSNAVQRGQEAGASNFVSAYLTGLFK